MWPGHASEHGVARDGAHGQDDGAHFVRCQSTGQWALGRPLATLVNRQLQPATDNAGGFGRFSERVEPTPRPTGGPGRPQGADGMALGRRVREQGQLRPAPELLGQVHHREPET